jgi:hypothetical protein
LIGISEPSLDGSRTWKVSFTKGVAEPAQPNWQLIGEMLFAASIYE